MSKAVVFGTGSWGTTFAMILAEAGTDTTLWGRRAEVVDAINDRHENPEYLPGVKLPEALTATTDPVAAMVGADFVVLAVPAQTLRGNLAEWKDAIPPGAVLVSLMKGVELGTGKRMSEVICEVAEVPESRVAVVSGPNLVPELARRQPAAAVVACTDDEVASRLQDACHLPWFRTYTNADVVGVELGGAVKNVIALAVGVAAGMGLGDNIRATLITRGLAEIARLGAALGADQHTFAGLAGMGDLIATCTSPLSRNRTFGENLGRGMTLAEVVAATKQTAEGVKSCESVLELARKHDVEMPITEVVVGVVHDGLSPSEAALLLMNRTPKPERYGL
ncbi:NAD(P)H-dependent glycerol-3-phosphate dehydrogenase [Planotetraspora kaengkrachanensis]|uniref:Glycerol-3-phosphate dehydrogenase [NAD(P)+] n=1 Tax=Planotetraspora kaengkrachanensis TaxID=575193 RepID=A0A8J3PVV2_9ACTN|nr:NAD(P)H-dependent glycerol-3-phosphate dehydrogenase [Planotetraspora kaengkrachanensis]GIG82036.1 glycerol-3-phosphate dehydrogenase [NAD(P)+] [Planotetraspora kaengkrachanensis]